MRSWLATLVVAVSVAGVMTAAVATAGPAAANTTTCTGRCRDVTVPVRAGVTITSNAVRLLLPTGYSKSTTRYPVIYLLCGAGGDQTEWTRSSNIAAFAATAPAIFVMPDCGGGVGKPGWYSDWANGQYQWETYYIDVLVPWIDAHYRTTMRRGIGGLSMGGYGAIALAARNPGVFTSVASFSGLPDTQVSGFSFVNYGMIPPGVWGNETTNVATWTAHNPRVLVNALRGVSLYLACGSGDPSLYNGPLEHISALDHVAFVAALNAANIGFHNGFHDGGAHTWPYFSMEAAWALPQMLTDLSA